jgi:hypothetical protein
MYSAGSDFELKNHDIPATKKTKGLWGDFLADVLGINDAKNCFQHGSIEGCAWTASNFIPGVDEIKAAGKFIKGVHDAAEAAKARKSAKALEDAGKCLTKNSFAPDTKVLTADGKSKPIKDLKVGDDVKTGDPTTGQPSGSHKITATMINHDSNLLDVVITAADGHHNVLHTTTEHPFWDATAHVWVDAAALTPGHMLVTAINQTVAVSGIFRLPSPAKDMYNLTVQDLHTYYVLAGATPVLVHNCAAPSIRISPAASDWATKGAHIHVGSSEVRVFPTGDGGVGFEGLRMSNGMASARDVEAARKAIMGSPELRADLIDKARSAMADMNDHNWGNSVNRASEMNFLIKALEKIG